MKIRRVLFSWIFGYLALFPLASAYLYCEETGLKYFENFTPEQYDHFHQNWQIIQDARGFIYAANQAGLLEYDGVSWRVIQVPGYDPVRSLAIDGQGRMFIGGKNSIGYLDPGLDGTQQFISLLDKIDEEKRGFGNVWKTCPTVEGVYFRTSKYLFRWHSGEFKVWPLAAGIRNIFFCRGEVYVQVGGLGLMVLETDNLRLIPGGEIFADEKIWMMAPHDDENILLGTRSAGFFLYNGRSFRPFPLHAKVEDYIRKNGLYYGTRLSCGDFALATSRGGLLVMDAGGELKYIFSKPGGLQNNNIRHILEDKEGNLWLALDKGISRLEYSSPFNHYDDRSGLPGLVLTVAHHRGDLYAGTDEGLYVLRSPEKTFHPVPGITGQCRSLLSRESDLLAAASTGLFQVNSPGDTVRRIFRDRSYFLLPSGKFPGTVWCAAETGLIMLQREGSRWLEKKRFMGQQGVTSIIEGRNGKVWLVMQSGEVLALDFQEGLDAPAATTYHFGADVPKPAIHRLSWAADHALLLTDKGLYRFDERKKTLVPDMLLGKEYAGGDGGAPVFRLLEERERTIWFQSESRNHMASQGGGGMYTIYSKPFRRLPTTAQLNEIYPESKNENLWLATNDGLICYDLNDRKDYDRDFGCRIRKIEVNGTLFRRRDTSVAPGVSTAEETAPVFEYNDRNLRFEFAAQFLEAEEKTQYRCLMEGYDDEWSSWSKVFVKGYTNLGPGNYIFRVQAKNLYDTLSREDTFAFRVLPPWYRTWWAFLSYAFVLFIFTYLIIKWRRSIKLEHERQRLRNEKQKLEHTVKERTKEINEKNRQLVAQTLQLTEQSEKLQEMDRIKSHFFANISHEFRTPLTLIMGPLEQILSDARYWELKEKTVVMLNNSRRLLRLINQLLDLSKLDSGKMKLQAAKQDIISFLRGAVASFEWIAEQKGQTLTFHSDKSKISLYFDGEKMEKVLSNLLTNAVKFTPEGGTITVSVTQIPEQVEISVKDTGIGIPSLHLPHIFDRFFQVDQQNRGDNDQKGIGIGLALTRELVTLHHGRIDVHSTEGKGTAFIIRLPLGNRHLTDEEIMSEADGSSQKREATIDQYLEIKEDEITLPESKTTEPDSENSEEGRDVILVVEDNADMRKYIRESLQTSYKVIEAADGNEGMRIAKEAVPDLIVSDIMMPGIDGYELCRRLKKDIATSHIPIIMLTAKASEESVIQGLETGADDYVTKPFSTQVLLTRIKNLIDLRKQLQLKLQRDNLKIPSEIKLTSVDAKFLKKFKEIIEDNLSDEDFNIDVLYKRLGLARATFFKKIKALTGETPNQFIVSYRLERGAQLLRENYGNVTDVALAVGFGSPAYFTRRFKEKFHTSPSTYQVSELKAKSEPGSS